MAFRFNPHEHLQDEIRRVVGEQLTIAERGLSGSGEALAGGLHEARKCAKRIRAVLRLVRQELGNAVYRRENSAYRDAARGLAAARDSAAAVETWQRLLAAVPDLLPAEEAARIGEWIGLRDRYFAEGLAADREAFQQTMEEFAAARRRLAEWPLGRGGFPLVRAGLRRTYANGRKCCRRAVDDPTTDNLHEWRKQAKYLWHHVRLIAPVRLEGLADDLHALSTMLGNEHDLAVLGELLAQQPQLLGPKAARQFARRLRNHRRDLQKQAVRLGQRLYSDRPNGFVARLEAAWTEAAGEPCEATRPGSGT